jgi:hypothetical protein
VLTGTQGRGAREKQAPAGVEFKSSRPVLFELATRFLPV